MHTIICDHIPPCCLRRPEYFIQGVQHKVDISLRVVNHYFWLIYLLSRAYSRCILYFYTHSSTNLFISAL